MNQLQRFLDGTKEEPRRVVPAGMSRAQFREMKRTLDKLRKKCRAGTITPRELATRLYELGVRPAGER